MSLKQRKQLLRSLEGTLSKRQEQKLQKALNQNPQLRSEKRRLEETDNRLTFDSPPHFQPYFTERVMQRINSGVESADLFSLMVQSFKRLTLAAALVIAVLISINVVKNQENLYLYDYMVSEMSLEKVITPDLDQSLEDLL